jgi:hypothetical protein
MNLSTDRNSIMLRVVWDYEQVWWIMNAANTSVLVFKMIYRWGI